MKRAIAALLATTTAIALGGCRPSIHNEEQPNPCLDTEAHVTFSIEVTRPTDELGQTREAVEGMEMDIIIVTESPDPDYNGVIYFDTDETIPIGTVTRNPIRIQKMSPYGAQACWPAEKPVLFLVRAYLLPPVTLDLAPNYQTYDTLRCEIEDGENLHSEGFDYLDQSETTVGGADLFPENIRRGRDDPYIGVQCQYIYIPGGYQGDPINPKPDLPPRP